MDEDVSHPHWNQIIRVLRQCSFVYDSVISHCNLGCNVELCVICELALLFRSLHVGADDPIHIQHFLRVVSLTMPHLLVESDLPASQKVAQELRAILELLPTLMHDLRCRQCEASKKDAVFDPIINVSRMQSKFSKTLIQAIESASKKRLWCDSCQGFREFVMAAPLEEIVQSLFFIIDPSAYRSHHVVEEQIVLKREQTVMYLKGFLVESHGSRTKLDLKAMIYHNEHWMTCKNELIAEENNSVDKVKAITLVYDRHRECSDEVIKPLVDLKVSPQTHIALDAEYVFYDKVQIEFCSDGSQHIFKPNKARLARLSIVDADTDSVILDEFVALASDETIVDYCTKVSGIRPEDLTVGKSTHLLTARKVHNVALIYSNFFRN